MSDERTADFPISGLSCASCVAHAEQALLSVSGVVEASVHLTTSRARVRYDASLCSPSQLFEALTRAGYPPLPDSEEQSQAAHASPSTARGTAVVIAGLLFALVIMLVEMIFHRELGLPGQGLLLICSTIYLAFFLKESIAFAFAGLKRGTANMHTLVVLGSFAAYAYSAFLVVMRRPEHLEFGTALGIVALVRLGRELEARARHRTTSALTALQSRLPRTAKVIRRGETVEISRSDVHVHDLMVVGAFEVFSADGIVISGESEADESMLTGESEPVAKRTSDRVYLGSRNGPGLLRVRVDRVEQESAWAKIARSVAEAMETKPPIQLLVDRIAARFVNLVLLIAALAVIVPLLMGLPLSVGLTRAIAVLVVACPCALGLATPAALAAAVGRAAKEGLLLRDGAVLESAHSVRAVVFDKTGTLTHGQPQLVSVQTTGSWSRETALSHACALEEGSVHPLAHALKKAHQLEGGEPLPIVERGSTRAGEGLVGSIDGVPFALRRFRPNDAGHFRLTGAATASVLERDGVPIALFQFEDAIRSEAANVISDLRGMGLHVAILSGDRRDAVSAVAASIGVEDFVAEVLPDGKVDALKVIRKESGGGVLMLGDGINDAPCLAEAEVGLAMGTGADVARSVSHGALLKEDLSVVVVFLRLARQTGRIIRQNLAWAFAYNLVMLPVAAGALAFAGIHVSPLWSAGAMGFSSLAVVLNALRLQRMRL